MSVNCLVGELSCSLRNPEVQYRQKKLGMIEKVVKEAGTDVVSGFTDGSCQLGCWRKFYT